MQASVTASSGRRTLEHGYQRYRLIKSLIEQERGPLEREHAVLDFGCGWGRIIRFFTREIDPQHLWGIDVNPIAIDTCRTTNSWARFAVVGPMPPSDFDDATFDAVYAYSVFSHLSEVSHLAWIEEIARVLKPGGGRRDHVASDGADEDRGGPEGSSPKRPRVGPRSDRLLPATGRRARRLRSRRLLLRHNRMNEHYGNAVVSEAYVRARWTEYFQVLDYVRPRSMPQTSSSVAAPPEALGRLPASPDAALALSG